MFKLCFTIACVWLSLSTIYGQAGTPDPTFGNQGKAVFLPQPILNKAYAVLEQADHKLLLCGYALSGSSNVIILLRLFSDGTADPDFGQNGIVQVSLGSDALCYAMALQADGRILLAGGAATAANGSKDFALLRFLPGGQADSTFSGDGIQTISFGTGDDVARAVLVQPDGNILLAGTSTNGNNALMAIARFKPDGSPDTDFSGDGKNTLAIGTIFTNGYAMALQSDGRIVLVGSAKFGMQDDVALARFMPAGFLDQSFGNAGQVVTNLGSDADSGNALAIQSDGKILVAGISGSSRDFVLLRYMPDGNPDPDFANQGLVQTDFAGSDDYANALLLQPDGKILVGGYSYQGALPDFAMAQYLASGTPDPDFGNQGLVTTDLEGGYDYGFPLILQADGKIVQAGYTFSNGHTALAAERYISGLVLGVLELSSANQLFVSPNPLGADAVLSFETPETGRFQLDLLDARGALIHTFYASKELQAGKQLEPLEFPSNMECGWYTLRLCGLNHYWSVKILRV